jgi:hypothetical protein
MSFLDRFKPQPRWKHADPAVRLAAVAELTGADPEHRQALLELASSDEDARVRRAAIGRVNDVTELARLARTEADEDTRRDLGERLAGIATAASERDGDAATALEGLTDQKQIAAVAKASPHDTIRTAALARVEDQRLLSGIARQAADPQTALDAVARVTEPSELVNIALKTDHKDAGIAALERAAEQSTGSELTETLDAVANRAKNKAVARRARAMAQSIEEAEAARRAALEHWQQQVANVLARVEAIGAAPVGPDTRIQLADAESTWLELAGSGTFAVDPDTNTRFGSLVADAHAAIDREERAQAERREAEERRASARAAKIALCERVEALRGEDVPAAVEEARQAWSAPAAGAEADGDSDSDLKARFVSACEQALERHANRQAISEAHARLDALSHEASDLVSAEPFDEQRWAALASEWHSLLPRADEPDAAVLQRFADAQAVVKGRADERQAAEERALRQQVQRIDQLIDRAHARATADDVTIREADRMVRDIRAAMDAPPAVPPADRSTLIERLKGALAAISPKLQDLREMDEWKRFANAAVQEELIARTEALRTKYHFDTENGPAPEDVDKAARELHEIQERWKQVAEAPRAQAQALWHRYRQAADPIQARAREFFAVRSEERKANLERKLALIARAEELADSTDWIKTADELKKLQQEWQQAGPVPRNDTRATWKRFREACDKFFTRRNADLAERKETWSANLARKEALIARAEELASSREWDRAAAEIRRLQSEWKTIGPVRRNKSEVVWQRFRTACDTFFDRYKRRDQIEVESRQADREALVAELESLALPEQGAAVAASPTADAAAVESETPSTVESAVAEAPAAPPADLLERVRSLRTRWNQSSSAVRQGADPLSVRFLDALERVMVTHPDRFHGTELDVDASRQKMEKLCARVEGFLADAPQAPANSSQALADMLREALASNTIGGRGSEEARWRAMAEDVRQAQASWSRLGPVPGQTGRELTERFHKACNRFFDQYRRRVPSAHAGGRGKELQAR